jgi:hypothetical protein
VSARRKATQGLHGVAAARKSAVPRAEPTYARTDIARRRDDVARWLSRAASSGHVVTWLMQKYRVSRRTAEGDLAAVRTQWIAAIEREEPQRRATLLGTLDEILRCAIVDREWSGATRAAATIARVCGFDRTTIAVDLLSSAQRSHLGGMQLEPARTAQQERATIKSLSLTPSQRRQRLLELTDRRDAPQDETDHDR